MNESRNNRLLIHHNCFMILALCLLIQMISLLPSKVFCIELITQMGHSGWVNWVDFYPDKKKDIVASAGKDGTIKFWDIRERKRSLIKTINAHQKEIFCISFSPDKQYIASASADKTIKVWNLQSDECILTLKGHEKAVTCVDFSPDSKYLVSGSYDHTIIIWSIKEEKPISSLLRHHSWVSSVQYSFDGDYIISGGGSPLPHKSKIIIWSAKKQEQVNSIQIESDVSFPITVSNKYIASGIAHKIYIWEIETCSLVSMINTDSKRVHSICFSPDHQFLYSASDNHKIFKWNMFDRSKKQELTDNTHFIQSIAIHPGGELLASGGKDNSVKVWNLENNKNIKSFDGYTYNIYSIDFSPDGRYFVTGNHDHSIKVWDIKNASLINTLIKNEQRDRYGHTDKVISVEYSSDGKYLASGSADNEIIIWKTADWSVLATNGSILNNNPLSLNLLSLSFCPDNTHIASCGYDNTVRIWEVENEKLIPVQLLNGHTSDVWSVSFNSHGKLLASSSSDNTIIIWNWKEGNVIMKFGHYADVWSTKFSSDGKFIASGGSDNLVKIWSLKDQKMIHELKGHEGGVRSLCFSHDGNYLASGGEGRLVKIWDLNTFNLVCSLIGHTAVVSSLSFSSDSKYLLSCAAEFILFQNIQCGDNTIKMWETKTWDHMMNILVLPQNEWFAYRPGNVYYNSSTKGDTYAAIRFQPFPKNIYSLDYYKKDLKKENISSENKAPMIKPRWFKRSWDQFRQDEIMHYIKTLSTLLLLFIVMLFFVNRQRKPDSFANIKKYFKIVNYKQPKKINGNIICMCNKQKDRYAFIFRLRNCNDLARIESFMSKLPKKYERSEVEVYLIYKNEEQPKSDDIYTVRKNICKVIIPIPVSEIINSYEPNEILINNFKKIRERHALSDDPYMDATPIIDPTWFYGRQEIINQICKLLIQGKHVGIFGVRKSGKTSLINHIKRNFFDIPCVHISFEIYSEFKAERVFSILLNKLHSFFKNKGIKPLENNFKMQCDESTFNYKFNQYVNCWRQNNRDEPFILMFDEIDKVFPHLKDKYDNKGNLNETVKTNLIEYINFVKVLRGMTESSDACLVVLMAGFRSDVCSKNKVAVSKENNITLDQNPFFNAVQKKNLKFLSKKDSGEMIHGIGRWKDINWSDDAAKKVFEYCGGDPYATRTFASMVCEKGKQKEIQVERVEKKAEWVMTNFNNISNDMVTIYEEGIISELTQEERHVLNTFKTIEHPKITRNDFPNLKESLNSLIFYGLINEDNKQLKLYCEFFRSYLDTINLV